MGIFEIVVDGKYSNTMTRIEQAAIHPASQNARNLHKRGRSYKAVVSPEAISCSSDVISNYSGMWYHLNRQTQPHRLEYGRQAA
jgi:hypothetical protein